MAVAMAGVERSLCLNLSGLCSVRTIGGESSVVKAQERGVTVEAEAYAGEGWSSGGQSLRYAGLTRRDRGTLVLVSRLSEFLVESVDAAWPALPAPRVTPPRAGDSATLRSLDSALHRRAYGRAQEVGSVLTAGLVDETAKSA